MKYISTENLVLIVEEFGYRNWVWNPDFSVQDLKAYWQSIEKANWETMKEVLTGDLFCIDDLPYDRQSDCLDEFMKLLNEDIYPYLHYCCDQDSHLFINNEKIFHKGYLGKIDIN